jgi:FkbH-like protein
MKLAEALQIVQTVPAGAPQLEVVLACGFTPLHLETFLRAQLCKLFPGRMPVVKTGLYGDLIGKLEGVDGALAAMVVIEWADLDPRLGLRRLGGWEPAKLPDILAQVEQFCERLHCCIAALARNIPVIATFPTLPLPPVSFTSAARASEFTLVLRSRVASLSALVSGIHGVRVIDAQRIDALSSAQRLDVKADLLSGFPYTLPHASILAGLLATLLKSPLPKKGLITDLDDTLWRGILGEVGVEGISWDLDNRSQMYGLYQQLLRSLASSGTLVAVASKNDPVLVEQAFGRRDLVLREADVFPFEVHWGAKSESVARILSAWNVAAADIVFVDDSPMDLAEVKVAYPDVECLLFPRESPQEAYELLEHLRDLFGKDAITQEDSLRSDNLRANATLRREIADVSSAPEEFLNQLGGKLALSMKKEPLDTRALELVNKSNQFNLNGRRFQQAEWQDWMKDKDTVFVAASYEDRYGPLGKIMVLAGTLDSSRPSGKQKLLVRAWAMSCRAFSRLIEYQLLRWLFSKLDLQEMEFDFLLTPRNMPTQNFLTRVLGAPPQANCCLSRTQFEQICPAISHSVEELPNG